MTDYGWKKQWTNVPICESLLSGETVEVHAIKLKKSSFCHSLRNEPPLGERERERE